MRSASTPTRPRGSKKLEAAGVTDVIVGFRDAYQPGADTQTLDEKLTMMHWYADEIIAKYRAETQRSRSLPLLAAAVERHSTKRSPAGASELAPGARSTVNAIR